MKTVIKPLYSFPRNQIFNNYPQGSRLRVRPNNRWWNCVQKDINECKYKNENLEREEKTADWEKSIKEEKVRIGL